MENGKLADEWRGGSDQVLFSWTFGTDLRFSSVVCLETSTSIIWSLWLCNIGVIHNSASYSQLNIDIRAEKNDQKWHFVERLWCLPYISLITSGIWVKQKKKFKSLSRFFLKENQRINSSEERRNLLGSWALGGGVTGLPQWALGPRLTWETKQYQLASSFFLWSSHHFFFLIIAGIFMQHGGSFFFFFPRTSSS